MAQSERGYSLFTVVFGDAAMPVGTRPGAVPDKAGLRTILAHQA